MSIDKKDHGTTLKLFQSRWISLLDHSPFGIVTYNPDGSVKGSNRAMKEIFSLTEEESEKAAAAYNILKDPQLERRGFAEPVRKAFAGEPAILPRAEYEVRTPIENNPVRVWLEGAIYPIHDGEGNLQEVVAIQADVSPLVRSMEDFRRTADALRESEERYRLSIESCDAGFVMSEKGKIILTNGKFLEMTGYPGEPEAVQDRSVFDFVHPDDKERVLDISRRRERGEAAPSRYSFKAVRSDGGERFAEISARAVEYEGRTVNIAFLQDLTSQREAEMALRESEERFREMAEHIQEVFWLFDWKKQKVIYASPAYEGIWGRSLQALYEDYGEWGESIHPEDRIAAAESFQATLKGEGGEQRVYRIVRPDGEVRLVSDRAFPIRGGQGEIVRVTGVAVDITDRKREERERQQLERKIQQTQKMESLGVLAGGIAHDFNNLLMAILGNAELALARLSPESPGRQFVEEVERATQRAAELTNQMLAYSGRGAFVMEPVRLNHIVREMAHLLKTVISKKATLQYSFEEDLPLIRADATQIRQVAMNLITNASEAIGERGGIILVSTGTMDADREWFEGAHLGEDLPAGRHVFLKVVDTGHGMDAEAREKLFDPFYTTKFTGRGLGLAVVQGILKGHGGAIKVDSTPEEGSSVTVLLPVSAIEVRQEKTPAEARDKEDLMRGKTVLLIDDDPNVRKVTEQMLSLRGVVVLLAADGREGLEVLRRQGGIDVVILDMTMPHLSGEETYRELRRFDTKTPVILSSGYSEQETMALFPGMGLAGFLKKPYQSDALFGKIMQALTEG